MNPSFHDVLAPFYKQALTVNTDTTPAQVLERILADNFQSINSHETKDKATLIRQFTGLWKLVPDLKFEPKDKVVEGNKVVIRSIITGTPQGNFMGMDWDGRTSFKVDAIDMHEIENNQIVRVHHVEDWMSALRALKA